MIMIKKIISGILVIVMMSVLLSGCASKRKNNDEPVVDTIYIGTHVADGDPRYRSPITGESFWAPDRMLAGEKALKTVQEKLGVDIQWKQWANSSTQDCLQTVLAGDPYCHIAVISTGSQANVLAQNVLQPLDKYMDLFDDPDTQWMVRPKVFGNYYFIDADLLYLTGWPICFNIDMIEAVPDLKDENGNTIYPYDLYKEGKWTWSVFEDYLQKIQNYYKGKKSVYGNEITTFNTNFMHIIQAALHSNGAHIYDGNSLGIDTPEAIEAAEYLTSLMERNLISCSASTYGKVANGGGTGTNNAFAAGESVFTNCARWRMGGISSTLAQRGESMGIIFFPRNDDIPYNGEYVPGKTKYSIDVPACDSTGVLKGFSEEETRLAIEAFQLYTMEFYKNLGRVDSVAEFRETMLESEAISFGLDIFHPQVGEDNLEVFSLLGSLKCNEFGEVMNLFGPYNIEIFGHSVYGINGSPKYALAVEAKKQAVYDRMDTVAEALKANEAVDAVAPSILQKNADVPIVFPKGTNPEEIDWSKVLTASDNADGTYDIKTESGEILIKANPLIEEADEAESRWDYEKDRMTVDVTKVDFNQTGAYPDSVEVGVTDTYGNTGVRKFSLYVYDKENTLPPILELKDQLPPLSLEVDTSTVDWAKLFVEKAEDVTGIDLKAFVSADVTELDVTMPDIYPVTIYVTDFAGNRTEVATKIEIR